MPDPRDGSQMEPFLTVQEWARYSPEQHAVWALLYRRRIETLQATASRVYLDGIDAIGLDDRRVPDLADVNRRLGVRTGWAAVPVTGFVPARAFFESLRRRRFPTTVTVRPKERLDYVPEPDIFHDVFGHVPLHADPAFAEFLQAFGAVAAKARDVHNVEAMARLFWFTVEFGLIHEEGRVKIYGSGLISSAEDARNALGPSCQRRPFSLDAVTAQPFRIDQVQEVLFVIDGFDQLREALTQLGAHLPRLAVSDGPPLAEP